MDITQLAGSIVEDARREADRLESDGHEQAMRIETEMERVLRERRERMMADAQRRKEDAVRREQARADREARIAILSCKRELIDAVFAQAATRIAARKGAARKALLARLLAHAREALPVANAIVAKPDATALRAMGVRVRGTTPGIGGFIASDADGARTVDLRFETILESIRADSVSEIASILFERDATSTGKTKRIRPRATGKANAKRLRR